MDDLLAFAFWLVLLFESLGPDWLRFAFLAPLLALGMWRFLKGALGAPVRYYPRLAAATLLITAFVAIAGLVTALKGIEPSSAGPYLAVLGAAPALYLVVVAIEPYRILRQFEWAALLLAAAIIAMGVCFYLDPETFFFVLERFDPSRGFFGSKSSAEGTDIANVYFPATLLLVPAGVLAFEQGRKAVFLLCVLALFLAPSRFGASVLALYAVLQSVLARRSGTPTRPRSRARRVLQRIGRLLILLLPVAAVLVLLQFDLSDDGTLIRLGHLRSVVAEFAANPLQLAFGFGAGSMFYSSGFQGMTDNIELSQVEVLRKYGLFGFTVLMTYVGTAWVTAWRGRGGRPLASAIACYFVVSMSNPVLFTLASMLLYGIALATERGTSRSILRSSR